MPPSPRRATPAAASRIESASSWSRRPPPAATTRPSSVWRTRSRPLRRTPRRRVEQRLESRVGERLDRVEHGEGGGVGALTPFLLTAISMRRRDSWSRSRSACEGADRRPGDGGALERSLRGGLRGRRAVRDDPVPPRRVRPLVHARGGAGALRRRSRGRSSSRSSGSGRTGTARSGCIPAGVAAGGIGMALAGVAPSYGLVVACVIVSGLGTAAFHPEGSKFAAYVERPPAGERDVALLDRRQPRLRARRARGGAARPRARAARRAAARWSRASLVAAVLLGLRGYLLGFVPDREARARVAGEDDIRSLVLLLTVITFRSLAWYGVLTFVPLWEVSLGHSKSYGNGAALVDAADRRDRDARRRADRRPDRAAHGAARRQRRRSAR